MDNLSKAVLRTLSWFDLQQYPLTTYECWFFLWQEETLPANISYRQIEETLQALKGAGWVVVNNGFWQLADSPPLVGIRMERARWSIAKKRRAEKAARLIAALPFVRLVALANTLSLNNAKQESDIDFLIIVRQGRIFFVRLITIILIQLLGWRRYGRKVTNRICLSFYLADDHLNIQSLAYDDDPYLTYWLVSLRQLAGNLSLAEFLRANYWLENHLPNSSKIWQLDSSENLLKKSQISLLERFLALKPLNMLEYLARWFELKLIKSHPKSRLGDGSSAVVVNDSVLKFHENDQRPFLAIHWREHSRQILNRAV